MNKDFSKGAIRLDVQSTAMNAIPPPLRSWSENSMNQCLFEEIPVYWEANDVITFLVDLGMYHQLLCDVLDNREKEQAQKFKTEYFKKRFIVSRSIMKHILQHILEANDPSDILLGKEKKGRIILHNRPDICISLSYSGPHIAITVGKQKIGSDIEVLRPIKDNKIAFCSIFINYPCRDDKKHIRQVIHVWTLVESYAKLYDENPYSLLNHNAVFKEANFVSYCINKHLIFSLASGKKQFTESLVWLDTSAKGKG
jgi:4'-phosphopantetheinyl transferase